MADNFPLTPGSGRNAATDEVTYSGDTSDVQLVRIVQVTGAEGSKTPVNLPGDATDGLLVNLGNNNDMTVTSIAAGDNNIGNVDVVTLPNVTLAAGTNTNEIVGDVAQDVAIAGNPVAIGYRASSAIPTPMSADGRVVYPWANRNGAPVVCMAPHVGLNADPWSLLHEAVQLTASSTGTDIVSPTAGKKIIVTKLQIQAGGTTAGAVQVYFGDGTYSRGTNRALFDGEFAPSATLKPGVIMDGPFIAGAADDNLRVASAANINPLTVSVWYYEI